MINKSMLKPLSYLILSALSLPVFAGDAAGNTVPLTVLLSNGVTQQNGDPVNLSHVEVRMGSGDGWTRLEDIKGNASSSETILAESGIATGLLRVTLPDGQRYVATFPIDANVLQLTVAPSLSAAASTGNAIAQQYELRTPTAVTRLTPVSATGNSWAVGCIGGVMGGGGLICSSSGYSFKDLLVGVFLGCIGGTLSSDADTFDQLVNEPGFWFEGGGYFVFTRITLHDKYNSYINSGGISTGGFRSVRSNIHWQ